VKGAVERWGEGVGCGAEGVGESGSFEHFQRLAGSSEGFKNLPHHETSVESRTALSEDGRRLGVAADAELQELPG